MFSVVIPTYNREDLLKECLQSLSNQSFKAFEVLVCDDGSTDNTAEVVKSFLGQLDVRHLVQENSGGPAAPRNLGIAHAKHDWICFLDSDDFWSSKKLEVLKSAIERSQRKIFCHAFAVIDANGMMGSVIGKYRRSLGYNDFETLIYNGGGVVNSSICVHRALLTRDYLFNENPRYHGIEDFIFLLNLTYKGHEIHTIPNVLGFYRVHGGNISANTQGQLVKWKHFFETVPFQQVNMQRVNALMEYLAIRNNSSLSNYERINLFSKLTIFSPAILGIKVKSAVLSFKYLIALIKEFFASDK